jgi:ABC-2 type transport system permease protein
MSSVAPVAATATPPGAPLVFGRTLHAEWTKLRTVRSTIWSLVLLVVLTLGFTGLNTWLTVSQWSNADTSSRARIIADPTGTILRVGFQLSQLTVCVLGVLVIASEYSTGMIRASLLAVPRRTPMLAAKAAVFAALRWSSPSVRRSRSRPSCSARRCCTATRRSRLTTRACGAP